VSQSKVTVHGELRVGGRQYVLIIPKTQVITQLPLIPRPLLPAASLLEKGRNAVETPLRLWRGIAASLWVRGVSLQTRKIDSADAENLQGAKPPAPQKTEPRDQKTEIRKQGYPSLRSGRANAPKTVAIIHVVSAVPVTRRTAEIRISDEPRAATHNAHRIERLFGYSLIECFSRFISFAPVIWTVRIREQRLQIKRLLRVVEIVVACARPLEHIAAQIERADPRRAAGSGRTAVGIDDIRCTLLLNTVIGDVFRDQHVAPRVGQAVGSTRSVFPLALSRQTGTAR